MADSGVLNNFLCESSISKARLHVIKGKHLSCSEVSPTITITKLCLCVFPATAARPYMTCLQLGLRPHKATVPPYPNCRSLIQQVVEQVLQQV